MDLVTKENFKIDFVIPHLNNSGLRKTLTTIRKNTYPHNIGKIILVDQNPEGYQQVDDLVDIHIKMANAKFAKAVNTGFRLADSRWVAAWNDDCECISPRWIEGIVETFRRYSTAVGCNPSSPRNPAYSGGDPVDHPNFSYKEEWSELDYDKLINEVLHGYVYDGICTYATVFDMEKLNKVVGVIPGKCWYDERFQKSGGEDYDLDIRAYASGFRMLGTELSGCYHFWYKSKKIDTGKEGVKYDNFYNEKWSKDYNGKKIRSDIYGVFKDENGQKIVIGKDENGQDIYLKVKPEDVPQNLIREI